MEIDNKILTTEKKQISNNFYNKEIKPYIDYSNYLIRHKINIISPGLQMGVPLSTLLLHDWSKFKPNLYLTYADYFYGNRTPILTKAFRGYSTDHFITEKHHNSRMGLPTTTQIQLEALADRYSVGKTNAVLKGHPYPDFKTWIRKNKMPLLMNGKINLNTFMRINSI